MKGTEGEREGEEGEEGGRKVVKMSIKKREVGLRNENGKERKKRKMKEINL